MQLVLNETTRMRKSYIFKEPSARPAFVATLQQTRLRAKRTEHKNTHTYAIAKNKR